MLHRIKTSRWKKPDAVDVTFTPGMNAIVGQNYTGKSSLISAILFALGGSSVVPGSMLETSTPGPGKFSVELWFLNYRVIRTKSKAELYENGNETPIAVGTSVVNRRIALILGMPVKRFTDLKVARQKKTEKILSMGGTELFNIIQDLTGINDVSLMIDKLSTRSKKTEGAIEFLGFPEEEVENVKTRMIGMADKVERLAKELKINEEAYPLLEEETVRVRETLEAAEKAWSDYSKALKSYNDALHAAGEAEQRVETLKGEIPALLAPWTEDELEVLKSESAAKVKQIADYEEAKRKSGEAYKAAKNLEERLDSARMELSVAEAKVKKIVDSMDGLTYEPEEHQQVIEKVAELSAKITADKAKVAELEALKEKEVCPTCGKPFNDDDEHQRAMLFDAEDKIDELKAVIEVNQNALRLQKEKLPGLEKLKASCASLVAAKVLLKAHQTTKEDLDKKLEEASKFYVDQVAAEPMDADAVTELRNQLERFNKADNAYQRQKLRIDEAQRTLDRANEKAGAVKEPAEPVIVKPESLRETLTKALQAEKAGRARLQEAKSAHTDLAAQQRILIEKLNASQEQVDRKAQLMTQKEAQTRLLQYLRSSRDRFTQDVWAQFLVRASRFVRDCTGGRVTDLDRGEDGQFRYMENGNWYTLAEASGCQLNLMGLAVQMALADVAPCPLNVLIADEPTDSMEEEHSLAAMVALASCGRQVICITHKELDRSLFENVYEVERK